MWKSRITNTIFHNNILDMMLKNLQWNRDQRSIKHVNKLDIQTTWDWK